MGHLPIHHLVSYESYDMTHVMSAISISLNLVTRLLSQRFETNFTVSMQSYMMSNRHCPSHRLYA